MKKGDLITICSSPWDKRSLFGYKNGDIAIVLEVFPYPNTIALPSIRVFVFISEKIVTIPTLYTQQIGE
jgi:hypothetical protein|tara:strand:- start:1709 stop:1915 length:207 start_codon:yes stop_codon:yes gene_type:complete